MIIIYSLWSLNKKMEIPSDLCRNIFDYLINKPITRAMMRNRIKNKNYDLKDGYGSIEYWNTKCERYEFYFL